MRHVFTLIVISACMVQAFAQSVGIGTNSPSTSAILELKSSTKGLLFPRTSTTTRLAMAGIKGLMVYDSTLNHFFYHSGSTWLQVPSGPHPPIHWYISQYDNETLYHSGNVSLGQDWPSSFKLSVYGTVYVHDAAKTTIRLRGATSATEARILWELPGNTMHYNITQNLNKLYISRTTGSSGFVSDLVIDPNGSVGIGTSTPDVKLNVVGGGDVGNATGGYLQLGENTSANVGFDDNEIQARNNGLVSQLVLNNGGGPVRIGNAVVPTGYSLGVNGRVICEELKIQASSDWPDYVFHDDYTLRSFDELRNFIHTNNHLPNIPDAHTIDINGIEVGDMQKRMMEKIEELTLYILQLEEKNKLQDNEIETLKIGHK